MAMARSVPKTQIVGTLITSQSIFKRRFLTGCSALPDKSAAFTRLAEVRGEPIPLYFHHQNMPELAAIAKIWIGDGIQFKGAVPRPTSPDRLRALFPNLHSVNLNRTRGVRPRLPPQNLQLLA